MQPYYQDESVTIYNANCRDVLPTLDTVDLVLTDPPYGLDFAEWDGEIPEWFEAARAIAETVAFTTAPTTAWDYPRPDWMACWVREAAQSRTSYGGFNHWTPILIYGKCNLKTDVKRLHGMAAYNEKQNGFTHPSPKPLALFRWLIEGLEGHTILDPFMGSGTTLRAAKDLNRKAIGIEIEERYCEIAAKRMSQMVMALH
jgi:site-specific DNA-methyltransferase (adenine-specific)